MIISSENCKVEFFDQPEYVTNQSDKIKHILNNNKNDEQKVLELLEEIKRDLKNYELEYRIEELESKFSKDLSESTFNEIRELKKLQNIN